MPDCLFNLGDRQTFEFIAFCLIPNSTRRPTAEDLLNSDYFVSLDEDRNPLLNSAHGFTYTDLLAVWKTK